MTGHDVVAGVGLKLESVRREFATEDEVVVALEGIDLNVEAGEFVAVLGPSGCGKSTLLRLIAGLDRADGGKVDCRLPNSDCRIEEKPSPRSSVRSTGTPGKPGAIWEGGGVGFVFQDAHLLPWRNVLRNVELPLELEGMLSRERREAAVSALEAVGLGDALRRYPAQLSGGMKMRVSLARAMVARPGLLLLDEPFAALDEITRHGLDEQLRELWQRRGMTVVFVTHSIAEATFLADRAVVLSKRPGRVVLDHRVELPPKRDAALRTEQVFAREMRVLAEALERGMK